MDFELSEEQRLVVDSVRRFCASQVQPSAKSWDEHQALDPRVFEALAELGLMAMLVPAEDGGAGLDVKTSALVLEELGRGDASLAYAAFAHNFLGVPALLCFGDASQKAAWLPRLVSGQQLAGWALEEGNGGLDPARLAATATAEGAGYGLSGTKTNVALGAKAGLRFVTVRCGAPETFGTFALDPGHRGLAVEASNGALGLRAAGTAHWRLDGLHVGAEALLGAAVHGLETFRPLVERSWIGLAAISVGVARAALEVARAYALDRKQFGQPIAEFQAIQWMLADSATEIDAARLLVLRAADLADGPGPSKLGTAASMAKVLASETAVRAAMRAVQIHGGNGFVREFPVERHLRDAKVLQLAAPGRTLRTAMAAGLLAD